MSMGKKKSTTFSSGHRESKSKKSILLRSRYDIRVPLIRHGVNVTPKPLDPLLYDSGTVRASAIEVMIASRSPSQSVTRLESMQFFRVASARKSYLAHVHDDVYLESDAGTSEETEHESDVLEEVIEDFVPGKTPTKASLILSETNTIFLLDIPPSTALKGTIEGDTAEEKNKAYEFLTTGRGRNRKVVDASIQTVSYVKKTRDTTILSTSVQNDGAFASTWDMFDTFIKEERTPIKPKVQVKTSHHLLLDTDSGVPKNVDEDFLKSLEKNDRFLQAVNVVERLLSNNEYGPAQKRYKDLIRSSYLDMDLKYNYRLEPLWTFANDITKGKCVIGIDINKWNTDVIAVGYGRFNYNDPLMSGLVMLWNIKNPTQPERHYDFEESVSALAFSTKYPNLLAIGFFDGRVKILDTSSRDIKIVRKSIFGESPSFEPVLHAVWCPSTEDECDEWLLAGFADGRVCKYQITESRLKCTEMSRVTKVEGELKGIRSEMRDCPSGKTAVTRYTPASIVVLHPEEKATYLVGTGEGVVHRCSMNYLDRHLDIFQAHDGSIVTMKFSPFVNNIYLTAGDDAVCRLWVDGLFQPLLNNKIFLSPIYDLAWSSSHSTIFCTTRDCNVLVWDIQRKIYRQQSSTTNPHNAVNTIVKFSESGSCIIVGDVDGNVTIFALEELPIPPFFQENLLHEVLRKIAFTKPDLYRKLAALGI